MRYGSAKLNAEIIEKLLNDSKVTGKEIDVLTWLALFQNEYGHAFNVKYSDVCKDVGISIQEYYNCVYGLENKGYIRIMNRNYTAGWDIEILNNVFASSSDDKKRYLNINRDIVFSEKFKKFRANEKKIALKILIDYRTERDYYINLNKIAEWLGISNMQLIRSYIEKLKGFFKIGKKKNYNKDGKIIIFQRHNYEISNPFQEKSIFYHTTKHRVRALCRKYKIQYTDEEMDDLIILMNQYKEHSGILYDTIIDTMVRKKSIEPKLINYIISSKLKPQT